MKFWKNNKYKFKVIERGHPGVPGGGEKKFYASSNPSGEMTLNGLTKIH